MTRDGGVIRGGTSDGDGGHCVLRVALMKSLGGLEHLRDMGVGLVEVEGIYDRFRLSSRKKTKSVLCGMMRASIGVHDQER